ncbi:MAG: ligase-associated DNA damage response endonuclease PdeM [Pseudomonadota bacterium]
MNDARISGISTALNGAGLILRGSGALYWPDEGLLCASDLHLGKAERMARRGGPSLPPYETRDTLSRLEAEIEATGARTVLCLGDSFDDRAAAEALNEEEQLWIARLQAGRRWIWMEGNHDPGVTGFGGTYRTELTIGPLTFRHIAVPGAQGEISGHYHPKVQLPTRGRMISRPAFLCDSARLIMPAFGTYTGGLRSHDQALCGLMQRGAFAVMTGRVPVRVPMPRSAAFSDQSTPAASRSG